MRKTRQTVKNRIRSRITLYRARLRGDDLEDLVRLGVNHFAKDFPRLKSVGCPSPITLDALVESEELPPDEIRQHLLTCSECFTHYRQKLSDHHATEAISSAANPAGHVRTFRLVPSLGATLVGIIAIAAVIVLLTRPPETSHFNLIADSDPARSGMRSGSASISPEPSPSDGATKPEAIAVTHRKKPRTSTTQDKATIDLERYNALRDASGPRQRPLRLQTRLTELTIKLPAGSPKGRYRISLADPFGTPLQSAEASSRDGIEFSSNMNLSSVKPGQYLICVTRQAEIPQCVLGMVESTHNKRKPTGAN